MKNQGYALPVCPAARLRSAKRWPWRKREVARLRYELAHDRVRIGIEHCGRSDLTRARAEFLAAVELARERLEQAQRVFLGYHDVQVIAAGMLAGDGATVTAAMTEALRVSVDPHANPAVRIPNAAGRALFSWALGQDVLADPKPEVSMHFVQFTLWREIAVAATARDFETLRVKFDGLVRWVNEEVRSGEFRYSEDRLAYLPGQMIVKLAARDGMDLPRPSQPWWTTGVDL